VLPFGVTGRSWVSPLLRYPPETLAVAAQSAPNGTAEPAARTLQVLVVDDNVDAAKILLDIGLPLWDGYEVARRIRQEPRLRDTVLVAITGYEREGDRQRSQQAGFDHHLVKPADFRKVREILAAAAKAT
jgi:CheY-like chemotaxis protein